LQLEQPNFSPVRPVVGLSRLGPIASKGNPVRESASQRFD